MEFAQHRSNVFTSRLGQLGPLERRRQAMAITNPRDESVARGIRPCSCCRHKCSLDNCGAPSSTETPSLCHDGQWPKARLWLREIKVCWPGCQPQLQRSISLPQCLHVASHPPSRAACHPGARRATLGHHHFQSQAPQLPFCIRKQKQSSQGTASASLSNSR